ncbi:MAG: hypothetical protein KGH97_03145 [Patescibacteria group bacterium]|nr:hypothetical protein [Patescibacteria group bacterium]
MKTVFDHIDHIKGKPHHIRKKIALTTAATCAAGIGLVWLVGSLSLGAFAIQGSNFAESTGQGALVVDNTNIPNLAGAAAALPPSEQSASAPAHIEIIDAASSTPAKNTADQTIIPF